MIGKVEFISEEILTLAALLSLIILPRQIQCAQTTRYTETNPLPINIGNLQKLASLPPETLHQTFRLLENPYIATSLVENDRNSKERLVSGPLPSQFEEPLENSDLQNQILRRNGKPITLEEAVKDPILGPYFDGTIEEDSRNVKLNIRT